MQLSRMFLRPTTILPVLMLVISVATLPVGAQEPGSPRQNLPPVRQHKNVLDGNYIRYPLPLGEQRYGALVGERIKKFVNEITAFSRQSRDEGQRYWGRIAGTKYTDLAEQMVAARFREFGLKDVRMQPFDLPPQWFPTAWEVTASGGGKTLKFRTIYPGGRSTATR